MQDNLDGDRLIHFRCPDCAKDLAVRAAHGGQEVQCPQCGQSMSAPELSRDANVAMTATPVKDWTTKAYGLMFSDDSGIVHHGPERAAISKGVWGGVAMMVVAVTWFLAGLAFGYIFFYPFILFIIGVCVLCSRLWQHNRKA